jgi:hypothetical protein
VCAAVHRGDYVHDNPDDMAAVLRDYGNDLILPALEIYTQGAHDRRGDVQRVRRQARGRDERCARRRGRGRKLFQPKLNTGATRD